MPRVRCLKRTTIYQGRVITLVRDMLEIEGRRLTRETILHPGAVVVVPVLPDRRIVLVRQYRRAVDKILLELPAGTLERGERKDLCAKRELLEETGWRARSVRRLARFYAAPGFLSEEMTVFLATGLTEAMASPEPDELVRPVIMSLREALGKIRTGAIRDAKTIIGLWLAERHIHTRK